MFLLSLMIFFILMFSGVHFLFGGLLLEGASIVLLSGVIPVFFWRRRHHRHHHHHHDDNNCGNYLVCGSCGFLSGEACGDIGDCGDCDCDCGND